VVLPFVSYCEYFKNCAKVLCITAIKYKAGILVRNAITQIHRRRSKTVQNRYSP